MLFFSCDMDDIACGWVHGRCHRGDIYETAYKWLSQYCGFFPPLWISSDQDKLTGYAPRCGKVLFGFNKVRGFPVKYDMWMVLLGTLINLDTDNFRFIDERLVEGLNTLEEQGELTWSDCKTLDRFLKQRVFVDRDQFVVKSLDLRKSQLILCNDEAQRAIVSKKGFPSSRVKVLSTYSRLSRW